MFDMGQLACFVIANTCLVKVWTLNEMLVLAVRSLITVPFLCEGTADRRRRVDPDVGILAFIVGADTSSKVVTCGDTMGIGDMR